MNATELLAQVKVAAPCRARWTDMAGDERSRFCAQCSKHVYNFSAMSAQEALDLIRAKEGNLCGRFHRRSDGRILTTDCPVGRESYFRRLKLLGSTAAALLFSSMGVTAWSTYVLREEDRPPGRLARVYDEAVWKVKGWFGLNPPVVTMGVVCVPANNSVVVSQSGDSDQPVATEIVPVSDAAP